MALTEILDALREEGEAEVARITAERDERVAAALRAARAQAASEETAAASSLDADLAAESAIILNRAELQVERRLQATREVVLQDALGRARDRLARHRDGPAYRATLDALFGECVAFLGKVESVMVDPRDSEAVEAMLARRGLAARVSVSLETWGGVVAGDGSGAWVRNTLEDRLGRAEPELRRQIGDLVPGLRGAGLRSRT